MINPDLGRRVAWACGSELMQTFARRFPTAYAIFVSEVENAWNFNHLISTYQMLIEAGERELQQSARIGDLEMALKCYEIDAKRAAQRRLDIEERGWTRGD